MASFIITYHILVPIAMTHLYAYAIIRQHIYCAIQGSNINPPSHVDGWASCPPF
jgi:hypothetical protein